MLVWLALLPVLTAHRVSVWHDDLSLWRDASVWSEKPRPWLNRGLAAYIRGDFLEAEGALWRGQSLAHDLRRPAEERAVSLAIATVNLAYLHLGRGDVRQARALIRTIRDTYPRWEPGKVACRITAC